MQVFVCTDHDGHYPVGVCSVVVAEDEEKARALLVAELTTHGLKAGKGFSLRRLNIEQPRAFVILDGDC